MSLELEIFRQTTISKVKNENEPVLTLKGQNSSRWSKSLSVSLWLAGLMLSAAVELHELSVW